MKYGVDKTKEEPIYLQLYRQIKKDIVEGVCPRGSRLPSKRLLAAELGISVIPAEHALGLLCEEGYAEARERSGIFVIYRRDDFLSAGSCAEGVEPSFRRERRENGGSGAGEHVFPFPGLARTMRKVILDRGEDLLVKSPNRGCPELRAAIASYLQRSNGIAAHPRQIVIGSGAEYLYGLIVQLLGRERIYALEDPSYDQIARVYAANGVTFEKLELGRDGIRTPELERTRADVLHVTPFNSFPSGITAGASKRREYLEWARARTGYVIEDNYDSELTVSRKNEDTLFAMTEDGRVIYLNTFSGTVAPSVRVGYMVLPTGLCDRFEERLGFYSCTVPVFEQYLLTELLNSGDFERHVNRVRRLKRKENALGASVASGASAASAASGTSVSSTEEGHDREPMRPDPTEI